MHFGLVLSLPNSLYRNLKLSASFRDPYPEQITKKLRNALIVEILPACIKIIHLTL